jgi:hypothetical protein
MLYEYNYKADLLYAVREERVLLGFVEPLHRVVCPVA